MEIAIARMDGKFRVVIPKRLREKVGVVEKSTFIAYALKGVIFLRAANPGNDKLLEGLGVGKLLEVSEDV